MTKSFVLPDSRAFSIAKFPDLQLRIDFWAMDDSAILRGLMKGLKNILGDAVAGITDESEARKAIEKKIAKFHAGAIGDGTPTVDEFTKELRLQFSKWLIKQGAKKGDAGKVSRHPDGVKVTFLAIVASKGLDTAKAESLLKKWEDKAESIAAAKAEDDDDDLTMEVELGEDDESEEEEDSEIA